jgi:nucleolar protein 12
MAKKGKEAADADASAAVVRSLFSADNPFRRKESAPDETPPAPPAAAAAPTPATPVRKHPKLPVVEADAAEPSGKKRKEDGEGPPPPRRKRKRDEVEAGYERRRLGGAAAPEEEPAARPAVGKKRKAPDDVAVAAAGGSGDEEAFDDESKLLRTVFVGNLPLRTKRKALTKEFEAFGEVESVRIRSVPLTDVSTISLKFFLCVVESFGFMC